MIGFSAAALLLAQIYHFKIKEAKSGGWDIDLVFMINFCKFHMLAVNYKNAEKLSDTATAKELSERELFQAESLRQRVKFADFFHYFLFCGAAWTGMSHEYRAFDDFIHLKG